MAIEEILGRISSIDARDFNILSDSRAVFQAPSRNYSIPIILRIKEKIFNLKKAEKTVRFFWVPAHKGILYNKTVDRTANEAARVGRDSHLCLPTSDLRARNNKLRRDELLDWCRESGRTKETYYMKDYLKIKSHTWFGDLKLRRKSIVSICIHIV